MYLSFTVILIIIKMGMRNIYELRYTFNIGESFTVPWGINSLLLLYVRKISANIFIVQAMKI